jgi:hypothetical protein
MAWPSAGARSVRRRSWVPDAGLWYSNEDRKEVLAFLSFTERRRTYRRHRETSEFVTSRFAFRRTLRGDNLVIVYPPPYHLALISRILVQRIRLEFRIRGSNAECYLFVPFGPIEYPHSSDMVGIYSQLFTRV